MKIVVKNYENGGEELLGRQAEDAKDVASQTDRAKDDHEDSDNPEPERWIDKLVSFPKMQNKRF